MSVRKIGGKWYVDVFVKTPDGKPKRVRQICPIQRKQAALKYEREIREHILDGTFGVEEQEVVEIPTFEEFSNQFITKYAIPNNKASEVKTKRGHLRRYLIPEFGDMPLDHIGFEHIEDLKSNLLAKPLKAKTINNALTTLSRLLNYAEELAVLKAVPKIKRLKAEKPDFDFLTFNEADQLLEGANYNQEWYTMIFFALKTGVRYGELCELRWKDLDLPNGLMHVKRSYYDGNITTPKSGKPRLIPLSPDTIDLLKEIKHSRGELVFCKPDGGRHIHRRSDVALKRCCKKAGLRPIGWHVLRHSFASHLVGKGVHLKSIQELLGHSTIAMTERYAHTSSELVKDAVLTLDEPQKSKAMAE